LQHLSTGFGSATSIDTDYISDVGLVGALTDEEPWVASPQLGHRTEGCDARNEA